MKKKKLKRRRPFDTSAFRWYKKLISPERASIEKAFPNRGNRISYLDKIIKEFDRLIGQK